MEYVLIVQLILDMTSGSPDSYKHEFFQSYISQNTQQVFLAGKYICFQIYYHLISDEEIKISGRKVLSSLHYCKTNVIVTLTEGKLLAYGINIGLYQHL